MVATPIFVFVFQNLSRLRFHPKNGVNIVKARAQLFEEQDVKAWESVKRMSVMKNNIEVLKGTPKCPNLRTLFLSQNRLEDMIRDGKSELPIELKSLTKLKMLDLSCMYNLIKIPQHLISSYSKLQIFRMWLLGIQLYPNEDNVLNRGNEKLIDELKEKLERLETYASTLVEVWRRYKWKSCIPGFLQAPNVRTLSIFECAKMEEILS
ncbi:hypothetical protein Goari_005272 [Gossypium aridum]|uniref:Uncharacterized protein n=1 Tax=Gossypium aridum TaxID=34290 RepID=A0A7J8Y629_GOSAI|nr:hypothetical protein [Gossypium aridum]